MELPHPGDTIGRYRIVRLLGQGGMGAVYEARDLDFDRAVAVKVIKPSAIVDATDVPRFEREARLASQIDDEHVVQVHDFGVTPGGVPYLAMELLEGRSLDEEVRGAAVTAREAIDWGMQICEGLGAAHRRGIIHRDVKLSNVFVSQRKGRPLLKVVDFGLAREIVSARLTQTGTLLGTPRYMAPECLIAPKEVDARADVWALGVLMHRLLTGEFPFGGTDAELVHAIMDGSYTPPSDLDPRLQAVLSRCIEPSLERRFRSAVEVGAALSALRVAEKEPSGARVFWISMGLALLVPLLAIGLFVVTRRPARSTLALPSKVPIPAFSTPAPAPEPAPEPAPSASMAPIRAKPRFDMVMLGSMGFNRAPETSYAAYWGPFEGCARFVDCPPQARIAMSRTSESRDVEISSTTCIVPPAFRECVRHWSAQTRLTCVVAADECHESAVLYAVPAR